MVEESSRWRINRVFISFQSMSCFTLNESRFLHQPSSWLIGLDQILIQPTSLVINFYKSCFHITKGEYNWEAIPNWQVTSIF